MSTPAEPVWTPQAQRAYVVQIADLGRAALVNLHELIGVAGQTPPHPDEWRCLAGFLVPCGRISRLFEPAESRRQGRQFRELRAGKLRELFTVGAEWPLRERAVRDAEEHFDDRFDRWQEQQPMLTAELVESGAPVRVGAPPLRLIDRATWTVTVDAARLELIPVHRELVRIVRRCCGLEPLAELDTPQLALLLATLPDWPAELRLDAPTRRPDETVVAGAHPEAAAELNDVIARAVAAYQAAATAGPDLPSD